MAFLDEAERLAPTADLAIHTYGIRADIACRAGRYDEALEWCERCVELHASRCPAGCRATARAGSCGCSPRVGRADDAAARCARRGPSPTTWLAGTVDRCCSPAPTRCCSGDEAGIDAALASATGRMPFELALMRVLAAEIIAGPARVRWLREALDTYEAVGAESDGARVRRLLREAGGPVPRAGARPAAFPEELAKHGVTARETEVLRLLGDGLSNAAIAERLFLSVRTVETHVSSLLAKLQVESRGQLTALSATIGYERPVATLERRRLGPVVSRMCGSLARADDRRRRHTFEGGRMTATGRDDAAATREKVEEFLGRLLSIYTGSMLNYMIDIGHRTGLFVGGGAGPGDERGAREPRRAHRALRARVARARW